MESKTQPKKKRIAPQKAAELPVVASLPENIISASFQQESRAPPSSTAGIATEGIEIDIRKTPMVNIQQALKEHGFQWHAPAATQTGGSGGARTQFDVVKRVLDRETRLFQVRDALSEPGSESSTTESDGESEGLSEGSEEEEMPNVAPEGKQPLDNGQGVAMDVDDVEVELDQEQEEDWGPKNIGEYDLNDDFIDDSEVLHYFDNITKKAKYSGFYIHKGPLKMIDQAQEQKQARSSARKPRGESRAKAADAQPSSSNRERAKAKTLAAKKRLPPKSARSPEKEVSRKEGESVPQVPTETQPDKRGESMITEGIPNGLNDVARTL